jgi:hypothetical protein
MKLLKLPLWHTDEQHIKGAKIYKDTLMVQQMVKYYVQSLTFRICDV